MKRANFFTNVHFLTLSWRVYLNLAPRVQQRPHPLRPRRLLTPKAVKDFTEPDYEKQQWCISRVESKGRAPSCSSPKCSRHFQKGDLSVQVMARWIPPHNTGDGKKFTVDRKYHFCLKWSCLAETPPNSNLLTPPGKIRP